MEELTASDYVGFDIRKASGCADIYSNTTGIGCKVIGSDGEILYESCPSKYSCNICHNLKGLQGMIKQCSMAYLYGSYQAERFGGKYMFFCPLGLVHWASPIYSDGSMKGSFVGGPVQLVEPEEFLIEDIIRKNGIAETYLPEIKKSINKTPVIKTDLVNNLSELLYIMAIYASDVQPSKYLEDHVPQGPTDVVSYIHFIKTMGGNESPVDQYPLEKEKELLKLISLGDKTGSQKVLNEIFGHIFFSTGGNFEIIKARILELVVLLSRAALEGGADVEQIFGLNYSYLSQINAFHTIEDLTLWLSKIMARFTDCVFNLVGVKHVDVIYRVIEYIKKNYMRKISLEEIASHVYLSPSYFSKIFKEEMKYNFNNYLNHVRIEISKKLLLDETITLVHISNLVGYEDQSYFTKVFKKFTGVSPGKYRESRGKL